MKNYSLLFLYTFLIGIAGAHVHAIEIKCVKAAQATDVDVLKKQAGVTWTDIEGDICGAILTPDEIKALLAFFYGTEEATQQEHQSKPLVEFIEITVSDWLAKTKAKFIRPTMPQSCTTPIECIDSSACSCVDSECKKWLLSAHDTPMPASCIRTIQCEAPGNCYITDCSAYPCELVKRYCTADNCYCIDSECFKWLDWTPLYTEDLTAAVDNLPSLFQELLSNNPGLTVQDLDSLTHFQQSMSEGKSYNDALAIARIGK